MSWRAGSCLHEMFWSICSRRAGRGPRRSGNTLSVPPCFSGGILSISHYHCGSTLRSVRLHCHCGSTFQYVPAISSRYCTATVAAPWQYRTDHRQGIRQDDLTPQLTPLMSPNSSATSNPNSQCRMKNEVT